jgi:hypothetical protein
MNMVSENNHKSNSCNHLVNNNKLPSPIDNKEFNFRNFENHKLKINQKKEQLYF